MTLHTVAEPHATSAGTLIPEPRKRFVDPVWPLRLLVGVLLIAATCFRQAPGLVVADTKLDLTADPGRFLTRALSLWDEGNLGQLQNQAYGYLWPMGPFHWVFEALETPAWVTQRLWWTFVLSVAFLGMWRLAAALDVGRPWGRYLGALLFALSPRFLGEIAITSVEVWPMAVAPWVLVPLVDRRPAPARRRLLLSALAVSCLGGVNAVASGAALVLPTLWFATRRWNRRVVVQFAAWLACCLAAFAWWLGPLLLLGRYSPPFLDWIETAPVTTGTASPFTALQGTSAWLGFLATSTGPSWPAAWQFVSTPVLILVTGGIAVLGLVGLAHHRMPERQFAALGVVVGIALLTLGFTGAGTGPLAGPLQELLDGPLAPARNIHKFELVIRIPLILGMIHALGVAKAPSTLALARRRTRINDHRGLPEAVAVLVVGVVLAATWPALTASLSRGGYDAIPRHWHDTAAWLDARPEKGTALVVPGASFAEFSWGETRDEPLQALAKRPFAVRDVVPLGSAGATRLLDQVGRSLATGRGDATLAKTLKDAGVAFVVVRNDLRYGAGAEPLAVHQSLQRAGLQRLAEFGPRVGSPIETPRRTLNSHTLLPYSSVEIFGVPNPALPQRIPLSEVVVGVGGPEDAPAMARGTGAAASVLGSDVAALGDAAARLPLVVTDGARRREVAFGTGDGSASTILRAGDRGSDTRRVIDYVSDPSAPQTVLEWDGVADVAASSSASDATATLRLGAGHGVAAGLDGDLGTWWSSGRYGSTKDEWLEVRFDSYRDVGDLMLVVGPAVEGAARPTRISVTTDQGSVPVNVLSDQFTFVNLPSGPTKRVRIRLDEVEKGLTPAGFSIRELYLPEVAATPRLIVPGEATPDVLRLSVQNSGRSECFYVGERPLCSPHLLTQAEEPVGMFRGFTTTESTSYALSGTVLPRSSSALEKLLDSAEGPRVTATSRNLASPLGRPGSALDGNLGTGWTASSLDPVPTLHIDLSERRTISGFQMLVDPYLAASRPSTVRVRVPNGPTVVRDVDAKGFVRFPAVRTQQFSVEVVESEPKANVNAATGFTEFLPPGVSELKILGAQDLTQSVLENQNVVSPCGYGPDLRIDGKLVHTEVSGTAGQVLRDQPLTWQPCASDSLGLLSDRTVALSAGEHTVDATASAEFRPNSLVFTRTRSSAQPVEPARSLWVLPHNANDGWAAYDATGTRLTPVRVDGWKQAFLLPVGVTEPARVEFEPQRAYTLALTIGGALTLLLVLAALISCRTRRAGTPARATGPLPAAPGRRVVTIVAAATMPLQAGLGGLVALAYGAWAGRRARARRDRVRIIDALVALPALSAVAWVAANPYPESTVAFSSPVVQAAVLASVAALAFTSRASRENGPRS